MRGPSSIAVALSLGALSCARAPHDSAPSDSTSPGAPSFDSTSSLSGSRGTAASGSSAAGARERRWQERFDFDGDGEPDSIDVDFTGGAHCCYRIAVTLGARRFTLPFDLDGGYVRGLDLSRPERFAVVVGADGRAELRLQIATYNGDPDPLPRDLVTQYGVRSHRVAVRFDAAGPHVANLGWTCEDAVRAIERARWSGWEGLPASCDLAKVQSRLDPHPSADGTRAWTVPATPDLDLGALAREIGQAPVEGKVPGALGKRDRVWLARGLGVRVDRHGKPLEVLLFPATDLDRYRRDFAPPPAR